MERINAYENLRGLVYSPFYIGLAEGIFAEAGVDLKATLSSSGEETADGVAAGRVDISWGGPMRVMAAHDKNSTANLVCFGLAVSKDPFLVIARTPDPTFSASKLATKRLAVATHAPTPWLLLQEDVRRAGLDPDTIERTEGVDPEDALRQLTGGQIDYMLAFEPWGTIAEQSGQGVVISAGARRGPLAFTSFYAPAPFLTERPDAVCALIKGLGNCLTRLRTMPAEEAASIVKPWFPDFELNALSGAIQRYQRLGIWPQSPKITADGYVRLKSSLISGGFITSDPAFEKLVPRLD